MPSKKNEVDQFVLRFYDHPDLKKDAEKLARRDHTSVNKLILSVLDAYVVNEKMKGKKNIIEQDIVIRRILSTKNMLITFATYICIALSVFLLEVTEIIVLCIFILAVGYLAFISVATWFRLYVMSHFLDIVNKSKYRLFDPTSISPTDSVEKIELKNGNAYYVKQDKQYRKCDRKVDYNNDTLEMLQNGFYVIFVEKGTIRGLS